MNPPSIEFKNSISGRVKVAVIDAKTGEQVSSTGWQNNLILDRGLDATFRLPFATLISRCVAGTSNTPTKDLQDGFYSQTGATITRESGTRDFIAGDVGKLLRFSDGTERYITAYTDATHVTAGTSGAVPLVPGIAAIAAAASNSTDFTITAAGHGRQVGDRIVIAGVTPSGYNGNWTVASRTSTAITVTDAINPGTGTIFGTVALAALSTILYRVTQKVLGAQVENSGTYPEYAWEEDGQKSQYTYYDEPAGVTVLRHTFDFTERASNINYTEVGLTSETSVLVTAVTANGAKWVCDTNAAHGYIAGESITIAGASPSGYNGTFTVANVVNTTRFEITNATSPGTVTVPGEISARLFSRILLAGAVTVLTGQLLRVKYEIRLKSSGGLSGEYPTIDGGITGWPRPYNISSITSNGTAWTLTLGEAHHFIAGGKININGALRPKVAITAAASGPTDFTITAAGHGRTGGDSITIAGMTPSGYNGVFTVASVAGDDIVVTSVLNPGPGTVFGTVRQTSPGTWYDGEYTIASVTSTTIVITSALTIAAAGASGTAYSNTKRRLRMITYGFSRLHFQAIPTMPPRMQM